LLKKVIKREKLEKILGSCFRVARIRMKFSKSFIDEIGKRTQKKEIKADKQNNFIIFTVLFITIEI
jgi:hypothetical protein